MNEPRSSVYGASSAVVTGPVWSRRWFLNCLSAVTFVGLLVFHVWWWHEHGGPISWVLLIATPLLCFVPAGVIVKASRREWLREWASAHAFVHQRDPGWPEPGWRFPPFSTGRARRRRVRDGMTGQIGAYPATYFHFTWWNNNRVQFSSHYRNVFVLQLPAALPRLTMGVNIDTSTGQRVEFESADFGDRFSVYSTDQGFAHAVFTPRTIDALVDVGRESGAVLLTKFEIVDDLLVGVSTLGNRPKEITEIFDVMRIIASGIPNFIWSDRGTSGNRRER